MPMVFWPWVAQQSSTDDQTKVKEDGADEEAQDAEFTEKKTGDGDEKKESEAEEDTKKDKK